MSDKVNEDEGRTPLPLAQVAGRVFHEVVQNSGKPALFLDTDKQDIALDLLENHFSRPPNTNLVPFEQVRHLTDAADEARVDSRTGLPNKRAFDERLMSVYAHFLRSKEGFTVVMMDVDNFKYINDTYGHGAGDILIAKFADLLRKYMRKDDYSARWAGDEFTLILPNGDLDENALRALFLSDKIPHINRDLNEFIVERGWVWPGAIEEGTNTHISVGMCTVNEENAPALDEIVDLADLAAITDKKKRKIQQ